MNELGEAMIREDMYSTVEDGIEVALPEAQERKIPKEPMVVAANKDLYSILMDSKKLTKRKNEDMQLYFKETMTLLQRWNKVMCEQEGDPVSALIVDKLFKGMLTKVDELIQEKNDEVDEIQEVCDSKVK